FSAWICREPASSCWRLVTLTRVLYRRAKEVKASRTRSSRQASPLWGEAYGREMVRPRSGPPSAFTHKCRAAPMPTRPRRRARRRGRGGGGGLNLSRGALGGFRGFGGGRRRPPSPRRFTHSHPNRPLMHRWPLVTSWSRGEVTLTIFSSCTWTVSVQPTPQ